MCAGWSDGGKMKKEEKKKTGEQREGLKCADGGTVVVKLCENSVMCLTRQVSFLPLLLCILPPCLSLSLPLSPCLLSSSLSRPRGPFLSPPNVSLSLPSLPPSSAANSVFQEMQMSLKQNSRSGNSSLSTPSSAEERSVCGHNVHLCVQV